MTVLLPSCIVDSVQSIEPHNQIKRSSTLDSEWCKSIAGCLYLYHISLVVSFAGNDLYCPGW